MSQLTALSARALQGGGGSSKENGITEKTTIRRVKLPPRNAVYPKDSAVEQDFDRCSPLRGQMEFWVAFLFK